MANYEIDRMNFGSDLYTFKDAGAVRTATSAAQGKFLQTDANGNAVWGDAASASSVARFIRAIRFRPGAM